MYPKSTIMSVNPNSNPYGRIPKSLIFTHKRNSKPQQHQLHTPLLSQLQRKRGWFFEKKTMGHAKFSNGSHSKYFAAQIGSLSLFTTIVAFSLSFSILSPVSILLFGFFTVNTNFKSNDYMWVRTFWRGWRGEILLKDKYYLITCSLARLYVAYLWFGNQHFAHMLSSPLPSVTISSLSLLKK